ncbi:vascular cell adhesion protein 1 isoform X2 [Amia ocellicauda]|uniref:vascular cell adhesion protein 1 isoform X2 n=1 Tax=Amia ocellicauda TaxID=2972642 RepID=UPI0034639AFB
MRTCILHVLTLASLLTLCSGDAMDCPIEIYPERVVVRYGDPVAANCTVTQTTSGMGWEATVGPTGMQNDTSLLWRVSNLTDWNEEPRCFGIFLTEPIRCEKNLSISLYKYPDSVSISSVGHTGPMEEGRQYRLQCDVQSIAPVQYLSVNWYRGGALIHTLNFSEDTTRTPVNVSPTLLITPSRTDDGVQYTCEAELRLGPGGPQANQSEPLNITVLYCPIVIDPPTVVVRYGDPVEVNCTVTRTTRGMGWEASVGSIDMKTDVQSLLWSASSLTDWTAEPKCFANFKTEPKQCKKELNVTLYKYPDRVSISSVGHTGPMEEGRQYRLQCDVQSIAPVQYLSVNWYRGGALIHTENISEDTTRTPVNVSRTLLITPNRTDDRVQYTCEAELRLGPGGPQPNPVMKSEPLNATVLYGPELSGCRDRVEVMEHQTLGDSVVCTVQGSPAPETSWLKDGREVDASAPLSRTDGGLYTYRAFNTYGSTTHNVSVEVLYGPELSGCRDHVEVMEHQTLGDSVVCTVQGSPAPETSWLKDGREVDASAPLSRTDGGLYTYRAFNTYGSTTHNVSVEVLYCPIVIDPPTVVVRYGDPVEVNCTVTRTTRGMGWEATVGSIDMKTDVQSLLWSASSLTDWTAEPKCFAKIQTESKQCKKELNVTLYKYPDRVSISSVGHTGPMEEGRQYRLQCDVQSIAPVQYLSVNWYRGGALIHTETFTEDTTRTPVNVSRTLLITPNRTDDRVQYTCEAELRLGPGGPQPNPVMKSEPLNATVLYGPELSGCRDHVEVTEHQTLGDSVVCTVQGSPAPETSWLKDGREVDASAPLRRTDGGLYTYRAFNTYGSTTHNVSVEVLYCPIVIDPPTVVVRYGDPVEVNCTVTRTTRGMGWEATVGSIDMKTDVQSLLWSASSLTDWTAEPKCYANFKTAPKQCKKELNVTLYKYPDRVSISSVGHTGPMEEGRQYRLQCDVQSIAPVQYLSVNWYRGGALIHTETFTEDTTRTPVNVSRTLLITPNRTDDRVQYTCEAELRLGPGGPQPNPVMKSEPLNATVLYGPELSRCQDRVEVMENQTLGDSVVCTVQGSPAPETSWIKDGREVDASAPLSRTDGGLYTYRAFNTYGSTTHNVSVEVLYKPVFKSKSEDSLSIYQGELLVLNCSAHGNPPPKYHWKYSEALNKEERDIGDGSTYNVSEASPGQSGFYTCTVSNKQGETSQKFSVTVKEKDGGSAIIIGIIVGIIFLILLVILICAFIKDYRHKRGNYIIVGQQGSQANGSLLHNGHSDGIALETLPTV